MQCTIRDGNLYPTRRVYLYPYPVKEGITLFDWVQVRVYPSGWVQIAIPRKFKKVALYVLEQHHHKVKRISIRKENNNSSKNTKIFWNHVNNGQIVPSATVEICKFTMVGWILSPHLFILVSQILLCLMNYAMGIDYILGFDSILRNNLIICSL